MRVLRLFMLLVLIMVIITGCKKEKSHRITQTKAVTVANKQYKCAPVFKHDAIREMDEKVALSPFFLSEEVARKIIADSLAKYGITFDEVNKTFPGLNVDKIEISKKNTFIESTVIQKKPFEIDLYSSKRELGIIYASRKDFNSLRIVGKEFTDIPIEENARTTAERLVSLLNNYGKFNCGIFYDPSGRLNVQEYEKGLNSNANYRKQFLITTQVNEIKNQLNQQLNESREELNRIETKSPMNSKVAKLKNSITKLEARIEDIDTHAEPEAFSTLMKVVGEVNRKNAIKFEKKAKEDLAAQINDYVNWMKKNGKI